MDIHWLLKLYRAIRSIYLYSDYRLRQTPEQLAEILNNANPEANITPADVLAALAYGSLVEDRFEFDINIKYRSPRSRRHPSGTFTFAGKPLKSWQVKRISMFEKKYGEFKLRIENNPDQKEEKGND